MSSTWKNALEVDLSDREQRTDLEQAAKQYRWGRALALIGWLHLAAFCLCYYLTIVQNYHGSLGYLSIWLAELCGVWLTFRWCGGPRTTPRNQLEQFVRRVWIAYFILAFNLGSLNTLRGHKMFEFFPAIASLASFAFLMMSVVVHWRFFGAVVVMFSSGLLMAANLMHAYLIFAVAWWFVLNWIGAELWLHDRRRHLIASLANSPPKAQERIAVPIVND